MANTMSHKHERLLNGDWIVYNDVEDKAFDLSGSKIAILTEKQRQKMDDYKYRAEPARICDLEFYDLHTLVMWAINNGFIQERPRCLPDDPQRAVFVVTFPLLEHPGQTFAVVLDRGDEMRGDTEVDAKDDVIFELDFRYVQGADDYSKGIDTGWDHVTCRRMTAAEAEEATKSSVNASWWR